MNLEVAAAVRGLLDGGTITPELAAQVICCPVCLGPVVPQNKPWTFRCYACSYNWNPKDAGDFKQAVKKRVDRAVNGVTPAVMRKITPAEGVMAD